jgi:hypothetical protein
MMNFIVFELDDQSLTTLEIVIAALLGMFRIDCEFLSTHIAARRRKQDVRVQTLRFCGKPLQPTSQFASETDSHYLDTPWLQWSV